MQKLLLLFYVCHILVVIYGLTCYVNEGGEESECVACGYEFIKCGEKPTNQTCLPVLNLYPHFPLNECHEVINEQLCWVDVYICDTDYCNTQCGPSSSSEFINH